jgi:hypothetical protein
MCETHKNALARRRERFRHRYTYTSIDGAAQGSLGLSSVWQLGRLLIFHCPAHWKRSGHANLARKSSLFTTHKNRGLESRMFTGQQTWIE